MQNVHSAIDALPDAGVLEDMGTKKQKLLDNHEKQKGKKIKLPPRSGVHVAHLIEGLQKGCGDRKYVAVWAGLLKKMDAEHLNAGVALKALECLPPAVLAAAFLPFRCCSFLAVFVQISFLFLLI